MWRAKSLTGGGRTFCRIAEAKAATKGGGRVAHFDGEYTQVRQDEGEVRHRSQRTVVKPAKKEDAHTHLSVAQVEFSLLKSSAPHRRSGRKRRLSPKNVMLTKIATITRACSESSLISKTQPVTVSLRHISSGSHQKVESS